MMSRFAMCLFVLSVMACLACPAQAQDPASDRWWPTQKVPKALVRTSFELFKEVPRASGKPAPAPLGPEHMMVESVAGLAAQAVNEGRLDELVWIDIDNVEYRAWFRDLTARLKLEKRETLLPWELVKRYVGKGIVKGYILYSYDYSPGNPTDFRKGSDESANVATSVAGLLQGIVIDEAQEEKAVALGLKKLLDVRGKTEAWCFENYRDKLNRHFLLTQDPQMPNVRDIAIANKMMVIYGMDEPTPSVYKWLAPLSSILGWNGPDEGGAVSQMTRPGHVLLPNNWSLNAAVTAAGSESFEPKPLKHINANAIDWKGGKNAVSFIMSDGDNVQWFTGAFCRHKDYWGSRDHGAFPIGWGAPLGCLVQAAPDVYNYLQSTQRPNSTINLHAGGYYYPDLLGADLPEATRKEIRTRHAQRLNAYLKRTGGTTLMFLCMDLASPGALDIYETYAREIDGLTGMFAIQYAPYEAGNGKSYWVKNKQGVEIPVLTCKYCIWANLNQPGSGTPAKIARLLNEGAAKATPDAPFLCWAMTHTWSGFKHIDGNDENAENAKFGESGTEAAVTPTKWCVDRLKPEVKVVAPEELLWRVRMQHDPKATEAAIAASGAKATKE